MHQCRIERSAQCTPANRLLVALAPGTGWLGDLCELRSPFPMPANVGTRIGDRPRAFSSWSHPSAQPYLWFIASRATDTGRLGARWSCPNMYSCMMSAAGLRAGC